MLNNGETEIQVTCPGGPNASNSTQIQINCGNGTILTGVGNSFTDICRYTVPDTYDIECIVDGYTDNSCADTIRIDDPEINICGDGVVGQFEECDLGSAQEEDVFVTIDDIL